MLTRKKKKLLFYLTERNALTHNNIIKLSAFVNVS